MLHFSEISWSDQDCQEGIFDQLVDIPCGKCRRNFGDVHRIFIYCLLRMAHLWSHSVYETIQIHLDCCCVLNITASYSNGNFSYHASHSFLVKRHKSCTGWWWTSLAVALAEDKLRHTLDPDHRQVTEKNFISEEKEDFLTNFEQNASQWNKESVLSVFIAKEFDL